MILVQWKYVKLAQIIKQLVGAKISLKITERMNILTYNGISNPTQNPKNDSIQSHHTKAL